MKKLRLKERGDVALTPLKALELLQEGNARFQANLKINRNLLEQVNTTANGQFPFSVILSCIDSRTSAELIFDQGLGDIFSIRIAGNILNGDILGSMEFACALAGSKLIVVMGHSSCGAIKGACERVELEHLSGLLSKIQPVVELVEQNLNLSHDEVIQKVAEKNVGRIVREIRLRSRTLGTMITDGKLGIVGAMYSVESGAVEFQEMFCGNAGGVNEISFPK
ncbi:MAG: carbonic anhydrase [Deltaproteobacteria bacterium]|nr:carbonic anhydrase [Deltaproteobacteria bacterium]